MAVVNSRARTARHRMLATLAAVTMAAGLASIPALASAAAASPSGPNTPSRTASSGAGQARPQSAALAMLERRARTAFGQHRQAARTGLITGTVVGAYGLPVTSACVTAVGRAGSVTATAAPSGAFTIAGLAAGSYALEYRDCGAHGLDRAIWSGGAGWQRTAARVLIGAGQVRHVPAMMLPASPATVRSAAATWHRYLANASGRALSAAAAARTGQISGVVTGKGKRLRGVCVIAFPVNGGQGYGATTSKRGTYVLRHVRAGRYDVLFAPIFCFDGQDWLEQVYRGHNNPFDNGGNPVTVKAAKDTKGIDAKLRLGGEISGTVTTKSGRKLGGICVSANGTVPGGFVGIGLQTSADGSYRVHALFPGKWSVDFSIGCGNNANYAPASLKPVTITYGKRVTARTVVLVPGAILTGIVRLGSSSGTPLAGICVQATNGGGFFGGFGPGGPGSGVTNSAGRYRVDGLGTGTYQVQFYPGCSNGSIGNYVPATKYVHVTAGKVKGGVDVVLVPGAEISGTVTDTHGNPLAGMCINLIGPSGGNSPGQTLSDGSYYVNQLPAGTYEIGFATGCGNSGNYEQYWYNNQVDSSLATPIKLTRGASVHVDAQMRPGASISGTVTDSSGRKLTGICVEAAPNSQGGNGGQPQVAFSSRGTYQLGGLTPGQYLLDFGCGGTRRYADQWFPNEPDAGAAELLSVSSGQTLAVNAVLRPAGAMTGVVRGPSGRPLAGVCAFVSSTADRASSSAIFIFVTGSLQITNSRGVYRIVGLAAGRHDVLFSQCMSTRQYPDQWYRGQTSVQHATPVTVRAGATTSGIDATMRPGATVTGKVVNSSGKPVNYVCVSAYNSGTGQFGFATTGKTGTYTMRALATGSYTVTFSPCNLGVNLQTVERHVKVTAGRTARGVNARLVPGGSAQGVVTAAGSAVPAAFACVEFISANPANLGGFGFTDANGKYRAAGITPGSYKVYFNDPLCFGADGLAPQWYNDKPTQATADNVTITLGHTTTGIDAALQTDGAITGTVLGASSTPLSGICVTAVPLAAGFTPVVAISGTSGGFTLTEMLPGRYKVEFSSGCGVTGYRTQWWPDANSAQAATVITVSAATTAPGINATMTH